MDLTVPYGMKVGYEGNFLSFDFHQERAHLLIHFEGLGLTNYQKYQFEIRTGKRRPRKPDCLIRAGDNTQAALDGFLNLVMENIENNTN